MVPTENVTYINIKKELNPSTAKRITHKGFSRIPVYIDNKNQIIGIMLIKSLIGLNLEQGKTIEDFV